MSLRDHPGLLGAVLGLCLGMVKYAIAMRIIGAALSRDDEQDRDKIDFEAFGARLRPVRLALLVGAFGILPAVGYVAGRTLIR